MIDNLRTGDRFMAYNDLGSYAQAQAKTSDDLMVILLSNFPTTMMRTILASADAPNPQRADSFVRHLLKLQSIGDPGIFPLAPLAGSQDIQTQRTINLDPALMTYLDQMKRGALIHEWEDAILQVD